MLDSETWGDQVAVEVVGGIPYRMYTARPKQVDTLLALMRPWGDRPHIVQGDQVLAFGQVHHAVLAKSRALREAGINPRAHVVLLGWNSSEWIVNFWACLHARVIPVLANAWWSEAEITSALNLMRPAFTLADTHCAARMPAGVACGLWSIDTEGGPAVDGTPQPEAQSQSQAHENDTAVVIFTSGTSGVPKAVVLSHRAMLARLQMTLHVTRKFPHQVDRAAHENNRTTRGSDGRLRSPKLQAAKLPQLIVPTTPTTAMVKAGSAVFMPETGERLALYDPKTRAQSVFIHPEFVLSAPRDLVVSATLNTLSLAIEGLVSRAGDPMSDALLMHVIRLSLARLIEPGLASDAAARADLVVAAIMCRQGTDHTAAGITTVLGHAIGARHGVENGVLNGIVLPHALRFNGLLAEPGLRKVAAAMGVEAGGGEALLQAVIDRICACFGGLGAIQRLRDVGLLRDALPALADSGMSDWFLTGNPRRVEHASELQQVLKAAW